MLKRLLIAFILITVLVVAGSLIGRNIPSGSVFAQVQADDTGTSIRFTLANSAMQPCSFRCQVQNRTLKVELETSAGGESIGSDFHIALPASAYDDIVIRCDGQIVTISEPPAP